MNARMFRGWSALFREARPEFGPAEFAVVMLLLVLSAAVAFPRVRFRDRFATRDAAAAREQMDGDARRVVLLGSGESVYLADESSSLPLYAIAKSRQGSARAGHPTGAAVSVRGGVAAAADRTGRGRAAGAGAHRSRGTNDTMRRNVALITRIEQQPEWAVPYGHEFWRGPMTLWETEEAKQDRAAGGSPAKRERSLADVVESVSLAIQDDARTSNLVVRSGRYTASFLADGFRLAGSPAEAAGEAGGHPPPSATFRTLRVKAGGRTLYDAAGAAGAPAGKHALCNTAQALLNADAGLVERVEARHDGIVVSWVLKDPVPPGADLVIEAQLHDTIFAGVTSAGFHFWDALAGRDFLMRHAVALDARGQEWRVSMTADQGGIRLHIPARCLVEAAQPLVIETQVAPACDFSGGGLGPRPLPAALSRAGGDAVRLPSSVVQPSHPGRMSGPPGLLPPVETGVGGEKIAASDAAELSMLMEFRDRLVIFYGLAWSHVHDGIPHDRPTIKTQADSWRFLAESREARAQQKLGTFQGQIRQLHDLLIYHQSAGYDEDARALALAIENFTILPFTEDGQREANRLEQSIRTQLPDLFRAMQLPGMDPYVIFTTLRQAVWDAGMFHYYATQSLATRTGVADDWARKLADFDARSNAYDAVRRPLFSRNTAVPLRIAELGRMTDDCLESIRIGADTREGLGRLDREMDELKTTLRDAPMARCEDPTIRRQLAKLRLAHAELLQLRMDLSGYVSPSFDGARAEALLAAMEGKLRHACDEAAKQLVEPDEAAWAGLGIRNRQEARDVLTQRLGAARKLERMLQHVRAWRAEVVRHPGNNFASLGYLTSFARNKAEWDHLVVTGIYPAAWQDRPAAGNSLSGGEGFRKGSTVEGSVNSMLADLQEVWLCYGDY